MDCSWSQTLLSFIDGRRSVIGVRPLPVFAASRSQFDCPLRESRQFPLDRPPDSHASTTDLGSCAHCNVTRYWRLRRRLGLYISGGRSAGRPLSPHRCASVVSIPLKLTVNNRRADKFQINGCIRWRVSVLGLLLRSFVKLRCAIRTRRTRVDLHESAWVEWTVFANNENNFYKMAIYRMNSFNMSLGVS